MPRSHSSRVSRRLQALKNHCANKPFHCQRFGCQYFAVPGTNCCTSCGAGKPVDDPYKLMRVSNRFKKKVSNLVNKLTVSDKVFKSLLGENLREFLSNVYHLEKQRADMELPKLMFTAKQVLPLMQGYAENTAWNIVRQKEASISLHDKVLGRVLDHWNLGCKDFPPTIRCYWGSHGDLVTPVQLYKARKRALLHNPNAAGIMKPVLYCARIGDNKPTTLGFMRAGAILRKFRDLV